MIVVSINFKGRGKTYYFDPNGLTVAEGERVVVETSKGLELATCVQGNHEVTDERIVPPLRPVARIATADDLRISELCKTREKEAYVIAEQKIAEHGLDMKLVDVECNFEGSKILFFFTSDGRVDFRELVKDLAGIFRTRIELRQIGVRDEAKMLGGLGICGLPFCCHQFMDEFEPVSTKMAKTQSLSLNPAKISGSCGRLMCCLRYEQEAYEELVKSVPKNGAFVETPVGYGNVTQVNLLRQTVKVKLDDDESVRGFEADEVAAVPGGRPRPGEPLPHVLQYVPKPKPEPEEEPEDEWAIPPIFAEDTAGQTAETPAKEEKRTSRRRRGGRDKKQSADAETKPAKQESAPKEAAAEGGAKKSGSSRRRRRSGGAGQAQQTQKQEKPAEQKPKQDKPAGQNQKQDKPAGHRQRTDKPAGQKPRPEAASGQKPKSAQPAQQKPRPEAATESAEKKSGGSRRRRRKPRAPGQSGGSAAE